MDSFPGMELNIPKIAYLDIKYDGPSFEGVMNISSLGNELLGLEYCIREAFKKIKASDIKFKNINESDLDILVEPFKNNCFRKKITVKAARKQINSLTNKELSVLSIFTVLIVGAITTIYGNVNQITDDEIKKIISEEDVQDMLFEKLGDRVQASLLADEKFRKELAKSCLPVEEESDFVEIRSPNLQGKENMVVVDNSNKQKFFELGNVTKTKELLECIEKKEIFYGRINAIDLDATKNHIGFKIDGLGNEIRGELMNGEISSYKEYLGKWVLIEGIAYYSGTIPDRVEIEKITEAKQPLREAKNLTLSN